MPEFRELLDGYHRFRRNDYYRHKGRWEDLAEGQHPPVMIIACCDSRVDPATVFDLVPGQAFVLRNVANLVPPFQSEAGLAGARSAIEFGVTGLGVRHIVVMGHGACGGIKAALAGGDQGAPGHSFLDNWISLIDGPRDAVLADHACEDKQLALEQAAIRHSLANLRTFPYIAEREAAGSLKLHGCHFTIGTGRLLLLDEASGRFVND
ncbi:carbonic anhydrase [Sphingomicrobium astaxanthinifaciens]|uniref:carbonic anhydrase n=1 Tax=Sphingomicrobium astaxanthinifaciens TaxID=1227949 RepID=UPI001FCC9CCE|nr:carbonic anhydrase [Sphingomicrobium astaxanthinifaciens]MCJ7422383.1 carbonic anhydrase [Sphingomicrobium astaxanthinifaciens]